jgi:hypothetical protein
MLIGAMSAFDKVARELGLTTAQLSPELAASELRKDLVDWIGRLPNDIVRRLSEAPDDLVVGVTRDFVLRELSDQRPS